MVRVNLKTILGLPIITNQQRKCKAIFRVMFLGRKSQTSMIPTTQYYRTVLYNSKGELLCLQ